MTRPLLPRQHATPSAGGRRRATGRRRPAVVHACRVVGRATTRTLLRVSVEGTSHVPRSGPVLLAGAHTGLLDGPLVFFFAPRPAALLTKSEVFVPPLGRVLGWLGLVPVHRGLADRAALRAGLGELAQGRVLGVFPEGSRGSGSLEQISDGVAYLALRSGAPVVPLAVLGSAAAWPAGSRLPRLRARVRIVFGPPVNAGAAPGPERARSTVRATAEELRRALLRHVSTASGGQA